MSEPAPRTLVRRVFGGCERSFELMIEEIGELELLCRAGVGAVFQRLVSGQFSLADIRETIRLGLRGAGMGDSDATALVMAHVDRRPLVESLQLAVDILTALLTGLPAAPPGKHPAEGSADPATSPPSTRPAAPSA